LATRLELAGHSQAKQRISMKICLLGFNGSIHIQKWVIALSNYPDIDLHIITPKVGNQFDGVTYHHLKDFTGTRFDFILNILLVRKLIIKIKPDLVHAHYATRYGLLGALLNFHPYVITGWGADIFDRPKHPILKFILKYSLTKADAITVLSKITLNEIKKLTNKTVQIIPFGVDTLKFSRPTDFNNHDDSIFRIGTIRTLDYKYGVDYLVRAFGILSQKYQNMRLDIVGDGEDRENLENLVTDLNIADKVVFHGYVSQTTDFNKYIYMLNQFDVFCILSVLDSETFGVAAVEASACSLPVVATNVGGLPEVIEDNVTGIIVPIRSPEKTAEAIEKIYLDRHLRILLGSNGRRKVESVYNWEQNVEQMVALYKSLL
jgi:glycosyltransferase involved in cell wall biosynthesis